MRNRGWNFDPSYVRSNLIPMTTGLTLGLAAKPFATAYLSTSLTFTAAFTINANTSNGADNLGATICGGGGTGQGRGSYLAVNGNESAGAGWWELGTGDASGASGKIRLFHASSEFLISDLSNNTLWKFTANNELKFGGTNNHIMATTIDGSDTAAISVNAGGGFNSSGTRGGFLLMYGNEHGSVGSVVLSAGSATSGGLSLCSPASNGSIRHIVNSSDWFTVNADGTLKIHNTSAPGGTPSGGGYLYTESGALKYKGSSGTVTSIAPA